MIYVYVIRLCLFFYFDKKYNIKINILLYVKLKVNSYKNLINYMLNKL